VKSGKVRGCATAGAAGTTTKALISANPQAMPAMDFTKFIINNSQQAP
jgi:hypothetical protein